MTGVLHHANWPGPLPAPLNPLYTRRMLLVLLKSLHLLALAIGLGLGTANLFIGRMSSDPGITRPIQKRLSRIAFAALILLWVTGIWMVTQGHSLGGLSLWFWVKILAVLGMTAAAVTAQLALLRPGPDTPAKLKTLGGLVTGGAALAVVFAVLSFG